jgi:hypothetical protein
MIFGKGTLCVPFLRFVNSLIGDAHRYYIAGRCHLWVVHIYRVVGSRCPTLRGVGHLVTPGVIRWASPIAIILRGVAPLWIIFSGSKCFRNRGTKVNLSTRAYWASRYPRPQMCGIRG